jgi:hypothetical protein
LHLRIAASPGDKINTKSCIVASCSLRTSSSSPGDNIKCISMHVSLRKLRLIRKGPQT